MKHFADSEFWQTYHRLPKHVRRLADKNFKLLKPDPNHPSLSLKKIGQLRSARGGIHYRALAMESEKDLVWFWIGPHSEYDKIIKG